MTIYQYVFWDGDETTFHYVEGGSKNDVDKRAWELYNEFLNRYEVNDDCIPRTFDQFIYMPCMYISYKYHATVEVSYHEIEFEVRMK